jgi:hypothetical protein
MGSATSHILCDQKSHYRHFWNCDGVLVLEIKPFMSTITGEFYADLANELTRGVFHKNRGMISSRSCMNL